MNAAVNKERVGAIFAALAEGDGRPFNDALAEDVVWTVMGSAPWTGAYRGKEAVREELQRPVFANFTSRYRCRAERIIAEDDIVVVLARGDATTRSGQRYDNGYCFVIRLADSRIAEVTEYLDTALVDAVLDVPPRRGPS
jgi:ketosteroid isomerase-like protein